MSRTGKPLAFVAAGLLIAGALAACGSEEEPENRRAAPGAERAPTPLPPPDRKAFARILRSSGVLRAAAVPVAYGAAGPIAPDRLKRAAKALAAAHPRDPLLQRLRATALRALRRAASGGAGASAKQAATEAVAEADRVDAGLRRYAASNPAANAIPPG